MQAGAPERIQEWAEVGAARRDASRRRSFGQAGMNRQVNRAGSKCSSEAEANGRAKTKQPGTNHNHI